MLELTLRKHPQEVERWRRPMRRYWKALHPVEASFGVDYMLFLMWHESRGNPAALNLTYEDPGQRASGLMQHKPAYWAWRIGETIDALSGAGVEEAWMDESLLLYENPILDDATEEPLPVGIFHPRANIAAAVWLQGKQGWQAWSPSGTYPPGEYQPPKPGKGVWWVDGLGYRRLQGG